MKNYETLQDKIFEQEKAWAEAEDCRIGICECCPSSPYYNITLYTKDNV